MLTHGGSNVTAMHRMRQNARVVSALTGIPGAKGTDRCVR